MPMPRPGALLAQRWGGGMRQAHSVAQPISWESRSQAMTTVQSTLARRLTKENLTLLGCLTSWGNHSHWPCLTYPKGAAKGFPFRFWWGPREQQPGSP